MSRHDPLHCNPVLVRRRFCVLVLRDDHAFKPAICVGFRPVAVLRMNRSRTNYCRQLNGKEGRDFVVCRICGDRRQVISGRHLSKHDIDRETYIGEFGLSADELIAKTFRINQSRHKNYQALGKKDWGAALKDVYRRTGNVFARELQRNDSHIYTQGVWLYGDWNKALCAAGFNPERMRKRLRWSADETIAKIHVLHKNQKPLYAGFMMKNHGAVFHAGCRHFGTWGKALVAAGIVDKPPAKRLARDSVSLLNKLSAALYDQPRTGVSSLLRTELVLTFGSFDRALAELSRKEKSLPGWNKHKVIAELAGMHRARKNLAYAAVRKANVALVSAAERLFGGWGKALAAAGIDPNRYFVHFSWPIQRQQRRVLLSAD